MEYALLGFVTGLSLILALGAQNIFVIEQGLKKQYVFLICLICSTRTYLETFNAESMDNLLRPSMVEAAHKK